MEAVVRPETDDWLQVSDRPEVLTLAALRDARACFDAQTWFAERYGDEARVPLSRVLRDVTSVRPGLTWVAWWARSEKLPLVASDVYRARMQEATKKEADVARAADAACTAARNAAWALVGAGVITNDDFHRACDREEYTARQRRHDAVYEYINDRFAAVQAAADALDARPAPDPTTTR